MNAHAKDLTFNQTVTGSNPVALTKPLFLLVIIEINSCALSECARMWKIHVLTHPMSSAARLEISIPRIVPCTFHV